MRKLVLVSLLAFLTAHCSYEKGKGNGPCQIENISILEVYMARPDQLDKFDSFLRDTLKLPLEWAPFDIFGDSAIYDAAYFLGNTTLELLAQYEDEKKNDTKTRFNRILFESTNTNMTSSYLKNKGLSHIPPFDFNISSRGSSLPIGKQINLDSLSKLSNVNIAFWEYLPAGFNFYERSISAESQAELNDTLTSLFNRNPLGITGLSEVHLSISKEAEEEWIKLLGPGKNSGWKLENGLRISYSQTPASHGIDWITLSVKSLVESREFLLSKNLLFPEKEKTMINRKKVYGLKIFIEEE